MTTTIALTTRPRLREMVSRQDAADYAEEMRAWHKNQQRYTVALAAPGALLAADARYHRTATLRATITDADGNHYITVGDFQTLLCSCSERDCDHLRAYRLYL